MTATMSEPRTDLTPIVLTPAEYEALPDNPRVEIVDGVVQVMTPATRRHQIVVDKLKQALEACCPDELRIVREQQVRLGDVHRRNPDVMAVKASADDLDIYSYAPTDVVLAVEVISPGTQTVDRLHKPAEYAVAGIAYYWRVETNPLVVHVHQLGEAKRYLENGFFKPGDTIAAPGLSWAKIEVATLEP